MMQKKFIPINLCPLKDHYSAVARYSLMCHCYGFYALVISKAQLEIEFLMQY